MHNKRYICTYFIRTHRVIFYFLLAYLQNCVVREDIVGFSFSLFIHKAVWRGKTSGDYLLSLYLSTKLCGAGRHRVISFFIIYPQNVWRGKTSCDFLLSLYLFTELCGAGRHRVIFFSSFIHRHAELCGAGRHRVIFLFSLYLCTELCGVGRHRVIFYFKIVFINPQ